MTASDGTATSNALSFDLEHWHSATLVRDAVDDPVDRVEESVEVVLDLLDRHDVRATFFVVGEVAATHPELVDRVRSQGHEIGSHGHTHTPLFDLSPREFEAELDRAAAAIERATGVEPRGFRAPNFSVTRETAWAFGVLDAKGYRYDSSVFPAATWMYGVSDAPVAAYAVASDDPFRAGAARSGSDSLVEFPLSVVDASVRLPAVGTASVRVPVAGGFYVRVLPERALRWAIRRCNRRGRPANLYFHPWEFNPDVRVDSLPAHRRFVSFHGIEGLERKLDTLLSDFEFTTVGRVLEREPQPDGDQRGGIQRVTDTSD